MLGKRSAQRSLFEPLMLPHRVPQDSIYGRLGQVIDVLFRDEELEEMYCPDNGRPSIPPSLMSGVMLLQFHDNVSDEEVGRAAGFLPSKVDTLIDSTRCWGLGPQRILTTWYGMP